MNQTDNRYKLLYGFTLFETDDRTTLCSVEEVADFLLTHNGGIITEPDGAVLLHRLRIYTVMLNPEIIKMDGAYDTEEGCLSLLGGPRKCKRYKKIRVQYQTITMQARLKTYTGWTAQIIQHEMDHCNGILI